jgi:phosphopantetheine adenylyltransferase
LLSKSSHTLHDEKEEATRSSKFASRTRISTKPHVVALYSPQQIKYGVLCDELYIDSTGQMVQDFEKRQVLLHSVLGKPSHIKDIPVIAIAEAPSTSGTTFEIEMFLKARKFEK